MKNKFIFMFSLMLFLSCLAPLRGEGLLFQKDIHVAEDEVQDNVVSFGGTITIKGKLRENAIAFGGKIIVEGEVGESVVGFGAKITLKSTAIVRGDLVALGGTVVKEPGAVIEGDTVSFGFETAGDLTKFFKEGLFGVFGISLIPLLLIIKLISLLIWFILALIIAAIFPRQISFASGEVRKSFWPTFGTGFLAVIIFTGLIIFSALLSVILIGIPVLIALILIGLIIKTFSRVILFHFFGDSLARAFGKKQPSLLSAVILGFFVLSIIGFIPILGWLFSLFLSFVGWGAVIRTRFGTTGT